MSPITAHLGRALDGLVHVSAVGERSNALRHSLFIGSHLAAGLAALSAFPLWLALSGPVTPGQAVIFAWFAAPIGIAAYLSFTGRFAIAQLMSAVAFAALIVWVAGLTGGFRAPVLIWLAIVPFEAALSGSRRVAIAATAVAVLGWAILALTSVGAPPPSGAPSLVDILLVVAAVAYSGGLAVRVDAVYRENLAAARSGEERYRLLADNAADMITRHARNGDVEFVSPAARHLLGVPIAEIMGDGLFRRVHVADRPSFLTALSEAFNAGVDASAEFRLQRAGPATGRSAEGAFVAVEMRCRPAKDAVGAVTAVVAVTRELGERKAIESALRDAQETAERANLAKSHFLAHMSHELRTPLNAIIGFSEILETEVIGHLDPSRQREYARLIHASGEHLLQVVNGILDMSKIESGMFELALEPVPVAPLIEGCADMMGHQATERGIRLIRVVPTGLPEVMADRRAFRQILLNLLSNAIKFTDRGGSVTVAVRVEDRNLILSVKDTGIGIAAEDVPRLGTPFVQAESGYDRRFEGTGLGLSMVKGLAALHGGRLAIDSRLGFGTTATVTLPLDEAAAGAGSGTLHQGAWPMPDREKELKRA